jgi:methylated-DNA-[protein]-cysteine S-methyltransferase
MTYFTFSSPIGPLTAQIQDNKLTQLNLSQLDTPIETKLNPYAAHINCELECYFQNPNHLFNIELHLAGTPFQKKVWQALREIPCGSTLSYGELAEKLTTNARAIGNACRANPIPIIIPCHRIVAKNHLGGYSGATAGKLLDIKKWLLRHEKIE